MNGSQRHEVLVLTGLPGSGKTFYARYLEQRGYGRVSVDELLSRPRDDCSTLERAVVAAINGDDAPLRIEAAIHSGIVVEWGFHTSDLGRLSAMVERGYIAWFFDGARPAALDGWRRAHPGAPDEVWHDQVRRLDEARSQIETVFGANMIETVSGSGLYLAPEEIDRRLGSAIDQVDSSLSPDAKDRLQG